MPIVFASFADRAFSPDFIDRVLAIYSYFPELEDKIISCGEIKKKAAVRGTAISWTVPPVFRVVPGASYYTIAHELTHLVQGNGSDIPNGEVACDIWTINGCR